MTKRRYISSLLLNSRSRLHLSFVLFVFVFVLALCLFYIFVFSMSYHKNPDMTGSKSHRLRRANGAGRTDGVHVVSNNVHRVLVSYAYSPRSNDNEVYSAADNLMFFLRHGVMTNYISDDMTVVVTLNGHSICSNAATAHVKGGYEFEHVASEQTHASSALCAILLHSSKCCGVRIFRRANVGFDFGAHGAMLRSGIIDRHTFDAFIFLNGGVRGPFIPPVLRMDSKRGKWHWTRAFTERLGEGQDDARIVGTSIVCIPLSDPCYARFKRSCLGPTVEGFAFALVASAVEAILSNSTVFTAHKTKKDAILDGEYAMSTFARGHGWRMDTLQAAYQDVDWSNRKKWDCNDGKHPSRHHAYFGINMHPWETIFHKSHWSGKENVAGDIEYALGKWQDEHPI